MLRPWSHDTTHFILNGAASGRPAGLCARTCDPQAAAEAAATQCVSGTCGDGTLDFGEACDDGNTKNSDGCNATCTFIEYDRCLTAAPSDCDAETQSCKSQQVFTGQPEDYCVPNDPPAEDKNSEAVPVGCAALQSPATEDSTAAVTGYCWPPAKRAAWLNDVRR